MQVPSWEPLFSCLHSNSHTPFSLYVFNSFPSPMYRTVLTLPFSPSHNCFRNQQAPCLPPHFNIFTNSGVCCKSKLLSLTTSSSTSRPVIRVRGKKMLLEFPSSLWFVLRDYYLYLKLFLSWSAYVLPVQKHLPHLLIGFAFLHHYFFSVTILLNILFWKSIWLLLSLDYSWEHSFRIVLTQPSPAPYIFPGPGLVWNLLQLEKAFQQL